MKLEIKRIIVASIAITMFAAPAIVSAKDGSTTETEHSTMTTSTTSPSPSASVKPESTDRPRTDQVRHAETELKDQLEQMKQQRQAEVDTVKSDLRVKLDDAKKKICENHQSSINNLMDAMKQRRQNAFTHITNVATAVENFYVTKQLTVANYSDLVAAVDAAKTAAQASMDAQQAVPQLDCSGDHPRADVADFKEKRVGSIDAMQAYRNSVKALIKAVKAAVEAAKDTSNA